MNQFAFEAGEKILGNGVIVRIALAGHALDNVVLRKQFAVCGGSVLNAAIAMKDKSFRRSLPADGHSKSGFCKFGIDGFREGITDNFFGTKVFDGGKIEPALSGFDVSDVAHPRLIGSREREITVEQILRNA